MKENNTKQFILRIVVAFLLILVIFTFFSKTIHNNMLPKVGLISPSEGYLKNTLMIYDYEFDLIDTESMAATGNWRVKEVFVKKGEIVSEGQILFTIDTDRLLTELYRLEALAISIDNQLNNNYFSSGDRKAMVLNRDAAWLEYNLLKESFPISGEVASVYEGEILNLEVEKYDLLIPGQVYMEMITEDTKPVLKVNLTFAEESKYSEVTKIDARIDYRTVIKTEKLSISTKERNDNGYTLYIDIPDELEKRGIIQYLQLEKRSERYDQIIPTSCIQKDVNGDYIFLAQEVKSGQSFKSYIHIAYIQVIESNDIYSAVSIEPYVMSLYKDSIVSYTSKPIKDGDEVFIL